MPFFITTHSMCLMQCWVQWRLSAQSFAVLQWGLALASPST